MDHRYLGYRWTVFLLALGYWLYQFKALGSDSFGWQFRYLTIWALTASLLSAGMVLRHALDRGARPDTLASVAAVMNALVVLLYWRLWFTDPSLVNGGGPILWWQEYYLHLAGPILQWIDALILMGAFAHMRRVAICLALVILAYVGWSELIVQPLNDRPVGTVTRGLPYPFLNDMTVPERLGYYARTALMAAVFCAVGWGFVRLRRRVAGPLA